MSEAFAGLSRRVIRQGRAELQQPGVRPAGRIRRPGGGRKRLAEQEPLLAEDLERLVEPVTRGDPKSPLRWTCKSLRRLAEELQLGEPCAESIPLDGQNLAGCAQVSATH